MTEHDATEVAYKNGYSAGRKSAVLDITDEILDILRKYQGLSESIDDIEYKAFYQNKIAVISGIYDRIREDFLE